MNKIPSDTRFIKSSDSIVKANFGMLEKVLLRNIAKISDTPTPEQRLLVAVIAQAINDLKISHDKTRREAEEFMNSDVLKKYTELLGMEVSAVFDIARKSGYMNV